MPHVNAHLFVHARRGGAHLYDLDDPQVDELRADLDSKVARVLTTDGDAYVEVAAVFDDGALLVQGPQDFYVLN